MEQSIILVMIAAGVISTIMLIYYGLKLSSYCCLENTYGSRELVSHVVKPPRWSQSLASRIEYIDDTALDIIRERIRYLEGLVSRRLGAVPLISRSEALTTAIILRFKFIVWVSKEIGLIKALRIAIALLYLKKLYRKASKLSSIDKKRKEYHDTVKEILDRIDGLIARLEALKK